MVTAGVNRPSLLRHAHLRIKCKAPWPQRCHPSVAAPLRTQALCRRTRRIAGWFSINSNEFSQRAEAPVAHAPHHDEVFRTAKGAVFLAVFDDAGSHDLANSRKLFQLGWRCGVNVNSLVRAGERFLAGLRRGFWTFSGRCGTRRRLRA